MNQQDVIDKLGYPDKIIPCGGGMRSVAWRCGKCNVVYEFDEPVRPPAPCHCCGCIGFVKVDRVEH